MALGNPFKLLPLLDRIAVALERIADAVEALAEDIQRTPAAPPGIAVQAEPPATSLAEGAVDVSYFDPRRHLELVDIEARLQAARGEPPTEEEILQEYDRRMAAQAEAQG